MNLCVDVGNTQLKFGVYNAAGELVAHWIQKDWALEQLYERCAAYGIEAVILSSVRQSTLAIQAQLKQQFKQVLVVSTQLKLPIQHEYATPETLGNDRLAAVIGAQVLFPNQHLLVVDAGTCITYDFITKTGVYKGGSILPGIQMRLRAMHEFTAKLPLASAELPDSFIGNSTISSLQTGVLYGVVHELQGFAQQYSQAFGSLQVLVTGGDLHHFESQLKNQIFAEPNLVLLGLNELLRVNQLT